MVESEIASLISNTTKISIDTWDDPGSYPNALAAGPLPSYKYVDGIEGELLYKLTPEGVEWYRECPEDFIREELQPPEPDGVLSVEWGHKLNGDVLTLWAEDVESDPYYTGPEPDWDLIAKERRYR